MKPRAITEVERLQQRIGGDERLRSIIETTTEGVWLIDMEAKTALCNQRMADMLGCDISHLMSHSVLDFVFPEDMETAMARIGANLTGASEHFDIRFRRTDGKEVLVLASTSTLKDSNGAITGALGMFSDITDRKRAERELAASEERYRRIVETAAEGICTLDPEGRVTFMNEVAASMSGFSIAEAMGRKVFDAIFDEDVETVRKRMEQTRAGVRHSYELRLRRRDGVESWVHLSTSPLFDRGAFQGVLAMATNITERKANEAEMARQAESLKQSITDLQQFAYIASHDLKEPLRNIRAYAQLLSQRHGASLGADANEFLGFIVSGTAKMDALIRDLLLYSRVVNDDATRPMQSLSTATVLQWTRMNLETSIRESGATIEFGELPIILGHEPQILQLFANVISNAILFRSAEPPLIHVSAEPDGRFWNFSIRDNGMGIESGYHERIFGPFKRLHGPEFPGTGMGLAICRKIVEHHGGRMWVESEMGHGSTFRFTLPRP